MDFMKVFDQTVREIKREVNLKVLKVPEIEQKVLDATDDEPWGPHGTVMQEIAQATKKYSDCQIVMNTLWSRLSESGRNWRYVYKSLTVIEFLVANGSERAVDDIIEHTYQISALSSFEYVEPNGKDMGINVRKKVENIVALLNDKDKIQEARNKAAATRDKYIGLSSTGISSRSGSASFGSSSFRSNDRYGGFGNTRDSDRTVDSYKGRARFGDDKYEKSTSKPCRTVSGDNQGDGSKRDSSRYGRSQGTPASLKAVAKTSDSTKHASTPSKSSSVPSNYYEDDNDDFDPRGTSSSKPVAGSPRELDLFGQSLVGDLWDMPASVPNENPSVNSASSNVDLFANAPLASAPSNVQAGTSFQPNVDLFASQPAPSTASSSIDLFAAPGPVTTDTVDLFALQPENIPSESEQLRTKSVDLFDTQPENKFLGSEQVTSKAADPFSSVPLNNFDGSDLFGSFAPHTNPLSKEPSRNFTEDESNVNLNEKSQAESKAPSKDVFQVKSGIWADTLSRGLIDLNITAPKKVNLADVGILGGLTETDKTVQTGSGLGRSSFTSSATDIDDMFSNLRGQQNQPGGFPKSFKY